MLYKLKPPINSALVEILHFLVFLHYDLHALLAKATNQLCFNGMVYFRLSIHIETLQNIRISQTQRKETYSYEKTK